MTPACPDCGGGLANGRTVFVHAFSCPRRNEGEPARCDYSKCRDILPQHLVDLWGKKTCGTPCRVAAWKESVGYGHQSGHPVPLKAVRTASKKASGLQVSFRKAVEGCIEALTECGIDGDTAEAIAEKRMRAKLSDKQRARLEETERQAEPEPEPVAPVPLPLPAPTPLPTPEPVPVEPDLEPAAEQEPEVRIFQRQRDENDAMVWVEIDTVKTRTRAGVALSTWLEETYPEPLTGSYKAEGNGGEAETVWTAEAA